MERYAHLDCNQLPKTSACSLIRLTHLVGRQIYRENTRVRARRRQDGMNADERIRLFEWDDDHTLCHPSHLSNVTIPVCLSALIHLVVELLLE